MLIQEVNRSLRRRLPHELAAKEWKTTMSGGIHTRNRMLVRSRTSKDGDVGES